MSIELFVNVANRNLALLASFFSIYIILTNFNPLLYFKLECETRCLFILDHSIWRFTGHQSLRLHHGGIFSRLPAIN